MKSVLALEGMGKNSMYLPNRRDAGEQHGPTRKGRAPRCPYSLFNRHSCSITAPPQQCREWTKEYTSGRGVTQKGVVAHDKESWEMIQRYESILLRVCSPSPWAVEEKNLRVRAQSQPLAGKTFSPRVKSESSACLVTNHLFKPV